MYSKARIAGHPIHPMLIAFPVALYTATVVALFVHAGTQDPFWYRAAFWTNIGGVVMAAVAAVPGLIDLLNIPDHTRAKGTAWRHAGFNVLALGLFVISAVLIGRSWYNRSLISGAYVLDDAAPIAFGILGLLSTVTAGWLGWTLVQTHHVGVKPSQHVASGLPREDVEDLDELVMPPPTTVSVRHIEVQH